MAVNGGHAGTKKGPNWGHVKCVAAAVANLLPVPNFLSIVFLVREEPLGTEIESRDEEKGERLKKGKTNELKDEAELHMMKHRTRRG